MSLQWKGLARIHGVNVVALCRTESPDLGGIVKMERLGSEKRYLTAKRGAGRDRVAVGKPSESRQKVRIVAVFTVIRERRVNHQGGGLFSARDDLG